MDGALGLQLNNLSRADLRIRAADAMVLEADVEARLEACRMARANRGYAEADRIRTDLNREGVVASAVDGGSPAVVLAT